jgi:hypothetical protein
MKTIALTVLSILGLISISAKAQNSEERTLKPFDKVRITNEIRVYLTKGETESARVVASNISLEDIITEVNAKTLEITLKRGVYKDATIEVYLTYKELRDLFVSASGRAGVQSVIIGDKMVFNATTNGQIDAQIDLRTADISAAKGASIRLNGKIGSYEAKIATGAILSAYDVVADSAFVNVNSKGIAKVSANELLEANVRTGSTLTLIGTPKDKRIKTGVGATILEQ